ncbi:response regulator transcription factor [Deinococcus sp.]|uniref:response regulator transcription factor n=1 Tax=Deinococcus sp. TaxID=47478 RepID=UPI003C7CF7EB
MLLTDEADWGHGLRQRGGRDEQSLGAEEGYGASAGGRGERRPAATMIDLLVIEPSISVRKTLERLLESSGYTMRGVTREADALGQVSRQRPDLILSEVTLPGGGGLELCQQFRMAGLPVLLMSGLVSDQLRRASRDAGALDLLSKPIAPGELLGRLAYHLKLPTPATSALLQTSPTLLGSLMTRPGLLGAALIGAAGELVEQAGRTIPAALYRPFLIPAAGLDETQRSPFTLQCAQLDYPEHCLLLFRLPHPPGNTLICLIQNSSYASLIRYHLRSSPYMRL